MICVLCYPRELRPGKIRPGQALPTCATREAKQRWFRRLGPPAEYKLTAVEEQLARAAMLAASGASK